MGEVRKVLERIYENKRVFRALFLDERLVNKKYFLEGEIKIIKEAGLINIKNDYLSSNFFVNCPSVILISCSKASISSSFNFGNSANS